MRILIVEDDELSAKALTTVLEHQNYAVEIATDGQAAWDLVQAFDYDLIMLDVMLPKLDGISLCHKLRSHDFKMPILLLTGRDSSHDKAIGLDAGADDYVVKPFDCEEIVARVRALLRRGNSTVTPPVLEWGNLRFDPSSLEVRYDTRTVELTPKEYALLELFLRNPQRVYSCGTILEHVWSFDKIPTEEAVRTQIKGLRHKLKAAGAASDLIETVYGIGYRLKPLQAKTNKNKQSETEQQKQQTLAALAGVWNRFQDRIHEQVSVLEQAAVAVLENKLTQGLHVLAQQEAHTLAGVLGTFGSSKGSQLARTIEHQLQAGKSFGTKKGKQLRQLVKALRQEIEQTPQELVSASQTNNDEPPKLLIIDSDSQVTRELVSEAQMRGITAEVVTNLSKAEEKIAQVRPNVVLLDPAVDNTTEEGLTLLAQLQKTPAVPVLIFTACDSLSDRLEVARLGSRAFLQKPLPATQVLEAVTHVLQPADTSVEAVIMVVDDDPQILATLRSLLEPWGFKVITLNDSRRFWETLEASAPDLLILDIEIPHVSGIELCKVVRNDTRTCGLPILFLTAHTESAIVHEVFAVGADDFVSKPIVGPELVTRILNRLERIKLLRSLAETDPLTTVYNRHRATQDLNKFLRLSQRFNQPLCLAILDLDHFKQINDAFGHATGDVVLRQLGQLLRQSFRGEDVVCRWGGEEFVVGMYGMNQSDGVHRLEEVLKTLQKQEFIASNGSKFQVTFSAGVAQYPENGTDLQLLYRSADTALYQAKANGRNCVLPAATTAKPELSVTKH
ncbi:response regulator [Brasilonema sp. UFV-L1]|uniref:response regulator n=1 Tax=Brasilonema sp. UFV-L1 TaxID=2234130 RepID=UPI00145F5790|nr:response regulator [Brasilonema sp. UFV-L1]NMG06995.1 transcriptional regulator [Brasilonema sp. UFV-L1]